MPETLAAAPAPPAAAAAGRLPQVSEILPFELSGPERRRAVSRYELALALERLLLRLPDSGDPPRHPLGRLAREYRERRGAPPRRAAWLPDLPLACFGPDLPRLVETGIFQDYPDGAFRGRRALTRGELALALGRVLSGAAAPAARSGSTSGE